MGTDGGVHVAGRRRLTARKLLPIVISAGAVALASAEGWVANEPLLALVGAVVGASVLSELAAATFPPGGSAVTRHLAIAIPLVGVTVAMYLTGWGPVLGVGYLYAVVDSFRKHGSQAQLPLLVWLAVAVSAGQAAIALGVAPSLIDPSVVHGVAALGLIALGVSVEFFGAATRVRESQEARFSALVRHSADAIIVVAPDETISYASPAAVRMFGTNAEGLVGRPARSWVHPDDVHLAKELMKRVLRGRGDAVAGEVRLVAADGRPHRVEFTATNLLTDAAVQGVVVNARDISGRSGGQHFVDEDAKDPLTGLANRVFFEARLESASQRMAVAAKKFAVVVVDLDRFDRVNTTAGEAAGDRLLGAVADRLAACVRPGDVVARLGDDEFALLVGDVLGPDDVVAVAARVTGALRDPFALGQHDLCLTASVGIALCKGGDDAGDVLRQAQLAVRAAKKRGGDHYELFDSRLATTFRRRIDLEADLTRAIDHDEFVVYYQPVVDLRADAADAVVGFEALVRWEHPTRGVLLPDEFIPLAEENGAIDALGRWVLEEACRQAASWPADSGHGTDMHVNLSARQLNNPFLAQQVDAALRATSLDPHHLVLEITETVLMEDIDASLAAINVVREAGARFAIDDFGAGYSSFAYLTRLPVQLLKLDRSLIDRLALRRDAAVVETVVSLAHRIGLTALAEGVERPDQLEFVRRANCDLFQGFLFEEPLPAERARLLLG
jgi:diguanylate cyclase (GGDEF)-like protein/PAS domain S-box-containing protein